MAKDSNFWTLDAIMFVVSSVASPSGVASQICTETRQSLNGLTAHSPSGCLASTLPGRCSFLLARGPLSGWTAALGCIAMTSLTGKMPSAAVKAKTVPQKPSSLVGGRPVGSRRKSSPRVLVFVISTSLASSKGFVPGQQNLCVLYRFTG